jgi:predicted Zn-dependent protease
MPRALLSQWAFLSLLLLLALGCVGLSPQRESEIGAEEEAKLAATIGFADHEASRLWVEKVGRRLASVSDARDTAFRFHVLDSEVPNAFALPGGPVFGTRGLLTLVNSEAELAGVIAHEMAHITERHAARRMSAASPFAILLGVPLGIIGSITPTLGAALAAPIGVVAGGALSAYGREQEYEADRIGVALAARAGYEPEALASFLGTLEREEALQSEGVRARSFFASHPTTPERADRVRSLAETLTKAPGPAPFAATRPAMLERVEGLITGPNPAIGVFVGDEFLHPELEFALRLPPGWDHRNLPDAVVGMDPESAGKAFIALQIATEGQDPVEGARADGLEAADLDRLERRRIHGNDAASLGFEAKGTVVEVVWIAYGGMVYRIAGSWPAGVRAGTGPLFETTAASFRPLSAKDRARIQVEHLRVRRAREGEATAAFASRVGSAWSGPRIAVANAVPDTATLDAGERLKVGIAEAWEGRP